MFESNGVRGSTPVTPPHNVRCPLAPTLKASYHRGTVPSRRCCCTRSTPPPSSGAACSPGCPRARPRGSPAWPSTSWAGASRVGGYAGRAAVILFRQPALRGGCGGLCGPRGLGLHSGWMWMDAPASFEGDGVTSWAETPRWVGGCGWVALTDGRLPWAGPCTIPPADHQDWRKDTSLPVTPSGWSYSWGQGWGHAPRPCAGLCRAHTPCKHPHSPTLTQGTRLLPLPSPPDHRPEARAPGGVPAAAAGGQACGAGGHQPGRHHRGRLRACIPRGGRVRRRGCEGGRVRRCEGVSMGCTWVRVGGPPSAAANAPRVLPIAYSRPMPDHMAPVLLPPLPARRPCAA